MKISNATREQIESAISAASQLYSGNLVASPEGIRQRGPSSFLVRLSCRTYDLPGWRYVGDANRSPRKSKNASWEAHRDFMMALFEINPAAKIHTAMETYNGREDFERLYKGTAYVNIGSYYSAYTMPDMTGEIY